MTIHSAIGSLDGEGHAERGIVGADHADIQVR